MDSLQTILFLWHEMELFSLSNYCFFFSFLSQVNGMYCAIYHICMNIICLLLLLLLHYLLLLLVLLVTCSGNAKELSFLCEFVSG